MNFSTLLGRLLHVCLLLWTCPVVAQQKPPIVVFLADDLGFFEVPVYQKTPVRMPNLERLAQQGLSFDRAFCASPSCAPSRAALLTGRMPARNGAEPNHSYPRPEVPVLTRYLQAAGYEVVAFGKVAHDEAMNHKIGFDYYCSDRLHLADSMRAYFARRQSSKPVCVLLGDKRPHVPWNTQSTYDPATVALPPGWIDTPETRAHRARYYTDITGMDAELGRVMDLTQQLFKGQALFLFSSDHGAQWPFGKWNLYEAGIRTPLVVAWPGKVATQQHTTAMVSWVDILPTLFDLTATAIPAGLDGKSFAPVLLGQTRQFRTLVYTTHSGDGPENVYPIRSVRTARYKYIRNLHPEYVHTNHSDLYRKNGAGAYWNSWLEKAKTDSAAARLVRRYHIRPAEELYDLDRDPREQMNLAKNPKYDAQLRKMRGLEDAWLREQGDAQTVFNKPYLKNAPLPKLSVTP